MGTTLQLRWGDGVDNPSLDEMKNALAELDVDDPEHPDTWLSSDNGWTISAFGSGLVILTKWDRNGDHFDEYQISGVSRDKVLELWMLLQNNELARIDGEPWQRR